jgi:hypothetical protein
MSGYYVIHSLVAAVASTARGNFPLYSWNTDPIIVPLMARAFNQILERIRPHLLERPAPAGAVRPPSAYGCHPRFGPGIIPVIGPPWPFGPLWPDLDAPVSLGPARPRWFLPVAEGETTFPPLPLLPFEGMITSSAFGHLSSL